MRVIHARNVRDALPAGVRLLAEHGVREPSRSGPVLVAPWPVTTVYSHPCERVLLSPVRDANPFFHLAEALWMLAGRNDSGFLDHFVHNFGDRFAERGSTPPVVHGAYGHRWRHALGFDQLGEVVRHLRADPTDRQCVVQMWDATDPHWVATNPPNGYSYGQDDLRGNWRDRPCNTHCYLRIRTEVSTSALDLTVLCRSNDIVWGAYGANAVHFSVLQEYLAARIGCQTGTLYQVSNNFHTYEAELNRLMERSCLTVDSPPSHRLGRLPEVLRDTSPYPTPLPLVGHPESFDRVVALLLRTYESLGDGPPPNDAVGALHNPFLSGAVWPALRAHRQWRNKQPWGEWAARIAAPDWREACTEWLARRSK